MSTVTSIPLADSIAQDTNSEVCESLSESSLLTPVVGRDSDAKVSKKDASKTAQVAQENMNPRPSIAPLPGRLRMYVPPVNFGAVETNSIYRSGYPTSKNFDFINSLNIRTILTLVPEPLSEEYITFMEENHIRHYQIHIPANKDGKINITPETMATALAVVLNRNNHPLLIHCNRGKHRTGCVTACFRKTQYVQNEPAIAEYRDYSYPKCRDDDMRFINTFDPSIVLPIAQSQGWLPTPPPEPNDGFWHLKPQTKIPSYEDVAAIKPNDEPRLDSGPRISVR
ncbi:hypothetical protein D6C78_09883 [Aureobasidium pullulans]|uniref:diphosphoinositol-polyphosphate diphosphatase n=1 Tax=Aureobasidium pullulans TaxID=5580 RepID=A0A4S9WF69_AURPU|nr:hypothetical protein D6D28_07764 [Aureobasidium pullulans]THZ63576.1 hypothetical protein D6C85_08898 [Aureobasidium pullulans]TIA18198.1 hypothetical protein D6C81_05235 [Aureobasidium pullulans]TIA29985.1 hypothetical protein D6C78_09883 [Aureobasidium pullulans]